MVAETIDGRNLERRRCPARRMCVVTRSLENSVASDVFTGCAWPHSHGQSQAHTQIGIIRLPVPAGIFCTSPRPPSVRFIRPWRYKLPRATREIHGEITIALVLTPSAPARTGQAPGPGPDRAPRPGRWSSDGSCRLCDRRDNDGPARTPVSARHLGLAGPASRPLSEARNGAAPRTSHAHNDWPRIFSSPRARAPHPEHAHMLRWNFRL